MEKQLPDNIQIAFATGDRITGENGHVYYDFFNTNLRWLCGYNNDFISNEILELSQSLKNNHNEFKEIFNQVSSTLLSNAGKEYRITHFSDHTSLEILNEFYMENNKYPVYLSNNSFYQNTNAKNFIDLYLKEKDSKKINLTKEGLSIKQIKNFFKHHKKDISFFILSPILFETGLIISKETAELFHSLCKKYHIPFVWDESLTCFYRTGTFYLLNQYKFEPDFIVIDSNIYQNKSTHILLIHKRVKKKLKKQLNTEPRKREAANLILLLSIFRFIEENEIQDYLNGISHRLKHKLMALSSNLKNRFTINNKGIITQLEFSTENYAKRLYSYLENEHLLVFYNKNETITLIPQIILSIHSVDLIVQYINNFFRKGISILD